MSFSAKGFFNSSAANTEPAGGATQDSGWVLHILNGPQSQVQSPLTLGRHLVGNDPASCDLIMETGVDSRQVAIIWVSHQSVSLTVIKGEAWRGSDPISDTDYQELAGGDVLTLGRVSFLIAPAGGDYADVKPPAVLHRRASAQSADTFPLPIRSRIARGFGKTLRYGAMLSSIVALAITLLWASGFANAGRNADQQARHDLDYLQRHAEALGLQEVRFEHHGEPPTLIASGYVANPTVYATLERRISELPRPGIVRVARIDEMLRALGSRDALTMPHKMSYLGDGRFAAEVFAIDYPVYRNIATQAFRDHSSFKSLSIGVADIVSEDGSATAMISMHRMPGSLGRVETRGDSLPLIAGSQEIGAYAEVRLGKIPSLVTDDGRRLFEGAVLDDGSMIAQIGANDIQVIRSGFRRKLAVNGNTVTTMNTPPVNEVNRPAPTVHLPMQDTPLVLQMGPAEYR